MGQGSRSYRAALGCCLSPDTARGHPILVAHLPGPLPRPPPQEAWRGLPLKKVNRYAASKKLFRYNDRKLMEGEEHLSQSTLQFDSSQSKPQIEDGGSFLSRRGPPKLGYATT